MILRAVGDYKDTFDATTGKITRRVGVKVLDGTGDGWNKTNNSFTNNTLFSDRLVKKDLFICSHFQYNDGNTSNIPNACLGCANTSITVYFRYDNLSTVEDWKQYLADQYANGTPVTVYYPLATPVEETWSATTYCESGIKIATNLYNSAKFQNVIDALDTAVSTINNIVAGTIAQANSIGELASGKQTRPNPADSSDTTCPTSCPNYRQCLLVEKDDGTPCWYPINDPFYDFFRPIMANNLAGASGSFTNGYYQLEYIESTGTQYIDTGYTGNETTQINVDFQLTDAAYTILFGTGGADIHSGSNISNYFFANPPERQWGAYVNGSFTYAGVTVDLNRHTVRYNDNKNYYFDDTLFVSNKQPSFNKSIYLFASHADSAIRPIKTKLYSVQFYDNGTLVRDFVPVVSTANGKYGMYDKVHGVFYPNAAASGDDFTPGPIVANDAGVPRRGWEATWAANATYNLDSGQVHGETLCNNMDAGYFEIATAQKMNDANWNKVGNVCWCRMTGITVNNVFNTYDTVKWVSNPVSSGQNCLTACTCYSRAYNHADMRNSLYYEWK